MEIKQIPLSLVSPSPMNPRKTFDEDDLRELADNIEKQGLLQPITVRPRVVQIALGEEATDGYEIVCGERRYRAFNLLKAKEDALNIERTAAHRKKQDRFQSIPVIIREMSDEEAFDAMITENLQRQDVDPIEEAFAFGQLIQKGNTAEDIAARFGKSVRFVQDRVKLNNLIPELMLAVRDENMSISAAMIIAKLDEEQQRRYQSSYSNNPNGYSKQTAESFTRSLFMAIDKAPWYQTDNQDDEDFDGGCGQKCSECQFNTANHGCLFWDMKTQDAGRCTDRNRFNAKNIAFILDLLKNFEHPIVKRGQPLESGSVVLIDSEDYCNPATKALKAEVFDAIKDAGYEIVKANDIFDNKCWYTDERLTHNIKMGTVYQCLNIFNYDSVSLDTQWRYFKGKTDSTENKTASAESQSTTSQSADAMKLIQKRNRIKEIADENMATEFRTMAQSLEEAKRAGELSDAEMLAFQTIIFTLCGNAMLKRYGYKGYGKPSDRHFIDVIKQNRANWPKWVREFIRVTISSADMNYNELYRHCAGEVLKEWMPKETKEIVDKIREKLDKDLTKNADKLKALGYGTDGKLLPSPKKDIVAESKHPYTAFDEMKKKHPDSILLFRKCDVYEAYEQDASIIAITLGLALSQTTVNSKRIDVAGFPRNSHDKYLPELVRAGYRVAICENIENPK